MAQATVSLALQGRQGLPTPEAGQAPERLRLLTGRAGIMRCSERPSLVPPSRERAWAIAPASLPGGESSGGR